MPTLGFHVPDDSPLIDQVKKRAKERHAGKVSAYVGDVVKADLLRATGLTERSHTPDAMADDILVHLTEELLGKLDGQVMYHVVEHQDQRVVLRDILKEFLASQNHQIVAAEGVPPRKRRPLLPHDKDLPA